MYNKNLIFDIISIVSFFVIYKLQGMYAATFFLVFGTIIQIIFIISKNQKVEILQLLSMSIILILGTFTLLLKNPMFIKWKPSVVYFVTAIFFLFKIKKKPVLMTLLGSKIKLPLLVWKQLTIAWVFFFITMSLVNLYIAFNFDESIWVEFKVFGTLILTVLFALAQIAYLKLVQI